MLAYFDRLGHWAVFVFASAFTSFKKVDWEVAAELLFRSCRPFGDADRGGIYTKSIRNLAKISFLRKVFRGCLGLVERG